MARWHAPSCSSPHVCVGEDSIPKCSACGSSAHDQLQKLREHPPTSTSPIPPDEKPGQLNLSWPSSITYVRTARENNGIENQAAVLTDESRDSLQLPKEYPLVEHKSTPQKHDSIIHGSTLAADQLRLICLTAKDKDLPEDVIHLSLETHHDGETPYEAVSYTWGGEAGDDTLRHPIYIGEYWDILLQTRNCCAMLCYLRPFRGMRMFWVDAICINQRDVRERSSQVAKMGRIYSECYQVVLWLGDNIVSKRRPSVYPSRHLFHQLEDETVTLPIKEGNSPERSTIQRLLELRYFSRVWIIQELILAPRVVIPLGDKLFWVDPSMTTKLQHRTQGSWSWEETEAPWFQYATQGQLLHNSLHDLVTLTWQSQSSDLRDKIYGILGPVYSGHDVAPIKPDYGISLQHVLIGFFAHSIIVEKVAQLLFKASDDAWGRLFSNGGEENTSWESVESCVEELRQTIQRENVEDIWKVFSGRWFRSDHRTSIPGLRTAFDDRPWYKDATVDADSGALSLYLTRLTSFAQAPVRASLSSGEGWYRYSVGVEQDIYILSRSNLGTVVKAGDEIFLLDTNFSQPIYLILRKTSNYEEFRLIAACPHLAMISLSSGGYDRVRAVPLAELHYSLDVDLRWLHHLLDQLDETGTRKLKKLFPGRRKENTTLREVLPLFLGAANDRFQNKFKSWKTFEQAYLDFLGPDFQPRVIDGVCELVVEPDLALGSKFSAEWVRSSLSSKPASKWLGWKKRKGKAGDRGKVIFSRSMSEIQDELDSKYFRFRGVTRPYVLDSNWLKCLLRILEGTDIGDRIMEKPLPEDRFQRGTHFTTDNVVKEFDLDGRTYKVCIL
ncbi:hypothetical protein NM208_g1697 [Fusarium decemcellulare]|uniref:Uncharacterized protein n=1 Tax=Fusarium decemcellulare TaxID=57161 RepID=A0ACC1SV71_9HYPO|nr:hypothetical protein NM208_g1697 [Fusarium decemcellulare]